MYEYYREVWIKYFARMVHSIYWNIRSMVSGKKAGCLYCQTPRPLLGISSYCDKGPKQRRKGRQRSKFWPIHYRVRGEGLYHFQRRMGETGEK
jgi:hypothetical protein